MARDPAAPNDLADPAAFGSAYELHHRAMVAAARRVLHDQAAAEDVVQDVFTELWSSPRSYDARRGSLRGYLTMVAKHRALDRWRSRLVATGAVERAKVLAAADSRRSEGPDEQVIRSETARSVRAAVDSLPPSQREAILLAYGTGLTTPEVATATGAPLGTAKSRVRLGLVAAGKVLSAQGAVG